MASFNRRDERRPPSLETYSDISLLKHFLGGMLSIDDFAFELTRRVSAEEPNFLIEYPKWRDKSEQALEISRIMSGLIQQRDPDAFARWPLNLPTARIVVNRD